MPDTVASSPPRVAVILTVFNRADLTVRCLDALFAQDLLAADLPGVELDVVLVDDGSTDGTGEIVAERFPEVRVLRGDGQRFWNGGMRMAWADALSRDPDVTLWLNDDTILYPSALGDLLDTLRSVGGEEVADAEVIVAGATVDPDTRTVNYSGVAQHPVRRLRFDLIAPNGRPQQADTMNGNAVLVPRAVVSRLGTLARAYTHSMGDYDYGLRARLAGFSIWITPDVVGECPSNPGFVATGDVAGDLQRLRGTKHLPTDEWQTFATRWAGPAWPLYWLSPYVRRTVAVLRTAVGTSA
ncbi:MAG: glycosyltransferase family 2 protein [Actinomycetota bacterium]